MKKTIISIFLLFSFSIFSETHLLTLGDKHYKNNIVVDDYVESNNGEQESSTPFNTNDISDFLLSNGSTFTGTITAGGYIVPVNNGSFSNGYTYYEFVATNKSFTGVSSTLTFDTNNSWLWYGYNQNFYHASAYQGVVGSYSASNRMSFLIKQPEGKLWIAKDGVWMNSTNPEIDSPPTQQLTPNQTYFPAAATGTGSGSSTHFYFAYEDWLYYDSLMSWLNN